MLNKVFFFILFSLFVSGPLLEGASRVIQYNGKPTPRSVMEIYAHRAGRGLAPENTLYACQSALRLGVDYLDVDVGMTKDGILVVTHDLTLNPDITRDAEGKYITRCIPVYQLTYQQLSIYNVGQINPHTKYASFFPMQYQLQEAKIPTLKEVIEYSKSIAGGGIGFQIEIKTNPTRPQLSASPEVFASALYALLKEMDIIDQTEVQAFDFRCLLALQKLDPQIKTTYLTRFRYCSYPIEWTAGYSVVNYNNSFPKMIKALGGSCWGPFEMDLTKEMLEEAHQEGLKVVPWGFPEEEGTEFNYPQILKLIDWGVDGIITDRPDELKGILSAQSYNLPEGITLPVKGRTELKH